MLSALPPVEDSLPSSFGRRIRRRAPAGISTGSSPPYVRRYLSRLRQPPWLIIIGLDERFPKPFEVCEESALQLLQAFEHNVPSAIQFTEVTHPEVPPSPDGYSSPGLSLLVLCCNDTLCR